MQNLVKVRRRTIDWAEIEDRTVFLLRLSKSAQIHNCTLSRLLMLAPTFAEHSLLSHDPE